MSVTMNEGIKHPTAKRKAALAVAILHGKTTPA